MAGTENTRMLTPHQFDGGLALIREATPLRYQFKQFEIRRGDILRIPLNDHVGRASIPIVEKGHFVKKYQPIARAAGRVSIDQHAPSSGQVVGLHYANSLPGKEVSEIVLECDGEDKSVESTEVLNLERLADNESRQEKILRRISSAGIVGMGGGGFPGHIKLEEGIHSPVKILLINAVECEPLANSDRYLLEHHLEAIIDSTMLLTSLLNPRQVVLAVSDQGDEQRYQDAIAGTDIDLLVTPARYPAGSEKQLIKLLTNQELPLNQLPIHMGVVCFNAATAMAMFRAAKYDEPCISRFVTINANRRWVVETPIGISLDDLFSRISEVDSAGMKYRVGGMMMGTTVEPSYSIKKISNEISLLGKLVNSPSTAEPCIRCGECTAVCPARLQPQKLFEYSKLGDVDSIQDFGLFDCIECGCCTYICPSKIPLVSYFQRSKREVNGLTTQTREREQLAARYEKHLMRQDDTTPAERDVTLADIGTLDADSMDTEIQRLKQRLAARRVEKSDNDAE